MKKTKKMLEVEDKLGESLDSYLRREYDKKNRTQIDIGEELNVCCSTIGKWLTNYNIKIKNSSEARLKSKKKPSKEWFEKEYVENRRSTVEIGEGFNIGSCTVGRWLKKYNIKLRNASEAQLKGKNIPSKKWFEKEYVKNRRSTVDISEELGISGCTIGRWLKKYNIKVRSMSEARLKGKKKPSKEWFEKEYVENRRSIFSISKELSIADSALIRWLKEYGIKTRSISEAKLKGKNIPSKKWFEKEYVKNRRTVVDISEEFGISGCTIGRWLKKYNIKTRSISEAKLKGKKKPSKEWLYEQYIIKGKSKNEIARERGIGWKIINKLIIEYDISREDNNNQRLENVIDGFLGGNEK